MMPTGHSTIYSTLHCTQFYQLLQQYQNTGRTASSYWQTSFPHFLTKLQSSGKESKTASVPLSVGTKRGVRCSEHKTHLCKMSTKNALFNSEKLPRCMIVQKSKLDSSKNNWDPRGHRIWAPIIIADDKIGLKTVQNSKTHSKIQPWDPWPLS